MDQSVRIAVCDDQPEDRRFVIELLAAYLDQNGIVAGIDQFDSGKEFLAAQPENYALIILDVLMGEINGIEVAKKLAEQHHGSQLIFCSTSREFAAESYDVDALQYLLKPIEPERLRRALDRFFEMRESMRSVAVKVGRAEEHIYLSEICSIDARGKHSVIHTKNGDVDTSTSLAELSALLPTDEFIRPIRYTIVSLKEIVKMPNVEVELSNGAKIPVSRGERETMKRLFSNYKWRQLRRRIID